MSGKTRVVYSVPLYRKTCQPLGSIAINMSAEGCYRSSGCGWGAPNAGNLWKLCQGAKSLKMSRNLPDGKIRHGYSKTQNQGRAKDSGKIRHWVLL